MSNILNRIFYLTHRIIKQWLLSGLFRQGFWNLIIKIAGAILALFVNVFLARILGATEFGIYTYTITIITLFSILTQMGLPTVLVRFFAEYKFSNEWEYAKGLSKYSLIITLSLSILFWAAVTVSSQTFLKSSDFGDPLFFASFLIPVLTISALRRGVFIGIGKSPAAQLPDEIFRHILFALCIFFVLAGGNAITNAQEAILILLFSAFVAMVSGLIMLKSNLPQTFFKSTPKFRNKIWTITTVPLILMSILEFVLNQVEILFLGHLTQPHDIGIYKVSQSGASVASFVLFSGNMTLSSIFSQKYRVKDLESLQNVAVKSARIITLITLIVSISIIYFADIVIEKFVGTIFLEGIPVIIILTTGHVINASLGSVATIMNMTGHQLATLYGFLFGSLISILMNTLLIPYYGIIGAALSSVMGMIVWNVFLTLYLNKLGIHCSIFGDKLFNMKNKSLIN